MRTDVFRAFGTDGLMHLVFRRTQTYLVRTALGDVERQREPRFYLDNGDALECAERYDTFRTSAGDLVVRVIPSSPKKRRTSGESATRRRTGP
jgi:hypothetical protein